MSLAVIPFPKSSPGTPFLQTQFCSTRTFHVTLFIARLIILFAFHNFSFSPFAVQRVVTRLFIIQIHAPLFYWNRPLDEIAWHAITRGQYVVRTATGFEATFIAYAHEEKCRNMCSLWETRGITRTTFFHWSRKLIIEYSFQRRSFHPSNARLP